MTDTNSMTQMPTTQSLDEAAQAAMSTNWAVAKRADFQTINVSIIAHARTLDTLHKREPVDPALTLIETLWGVNGKPKDMLKVFRSPQWKGIVAGPLGDSHD